MKILHLVQAYHPAIGGSEWLTQNISERLVSEYGDAVTVFTSNAYKPEAFWRTKGPLMPPGTENIRGVRVRRFKIFNGLQLIRELLARGSHRLKLPYNDWLRTLQTGPIIFDMTRAVAQSDAEVIFATAFPFLHMYYALAGAQRSRRPLVLLGSIHTADQWGYHRKMMYEAIRKADAYIALTTFERDHLIARGIDAQKITVIGAGVDVDTFVRAKGDTVREKMGWGREPIVGVIARQSELKRLDVVVRAMPKVWARYPETRLLMAGARTSYSSRLEQIIASLPLPQQERVTVLNNFEEQEKPHLLDACDIVAHPSGNESFGIAFVEAWACRKPVIGARIGAIPAVIDEGIDGLLTEYLNPESMAYAILQLLEHPRQRERMGQQGHQKVLNRYTWDIVTKRLRQVYQYVISKRQSR
jgi:glycosyltransferase involved in cell wall biosynthesis